LSNRGAATHQRRPNKIEYSKVFPKKENPSLVSYKMSLKEQAFLTQDEPEGGEVAQAGD